MEIFGFIFTYLVFFQLTAAQRISSDQIHFFVTEDIEDRNDRYVGTLVDRQNWANMHRTPVNMVANPVYNEGEGQAFRHVQANNDFSRGLQWLTTLLNINDINAAENAQWPPAGHTARFLGRKTRNFIIGNGNGQIPMTVVRNAFENEQNGRINQGDVVRVEWHYTVTARHDIVPTHFTFNVILDPYAVVLRKC